MDEVQTENEEPNLSTHSPSDLLIHAFKASGYAVNTEDGDDEDTGFVTVSEKEKRPDGTIGPVTRYSVNKGTGEIIGWRAL